MSEKTGRYARFLTNLDVVLRDGGGRLIDERAKASDVGPDGFHVQTQVPLTEGGKVTFTMDLGDADLVRGAAVLEAVARDAWGGYSAGARIVKISWKDRRRLRPARESRPGYDFSGLAKKVFFAFYLFIVVAGFHNILFHQPYMREALGDSLPAIGAALAVGFALIMLFRN